MKIKCPACNFENEEDAKFCINCNEPLVTPNIYINKENTNIKMIIKKERLRMNKKQKLFLAIFVPVILFFITLIIASYISGNYPYYYIETSYLLETWYVWLIFLIFICIFEYKMFEDKEMISNKKNKKLK
jgi:CDP-diglyceride synthetase